MEEIIKLFKGIADKGRLRTLALIVNNGELNVQQVASALQIPFSTASRHLRTLEICGWLKSRRESRWIYYQCKSLQPQINSLRDYIVESLNEEEELIQDTQRLLSNLTQLQSVKENQLQTKQKPIDKPPILPPLPPFSKR